MFIRNTLPNSELLVTLHPRHKPYGCAANLANQNIEDRLVVWMLSNSATSFDDRDEKNRSLLEETLKISSFPLEIAKSINSVIKP